MVRLIELFNKYVQWKILSYFLANPCTSVHVKELARRLNVSPGSVGSAVKLLHSEGVLVKEEKGLAHLYKLNTDHCVVLPLKKAYGIALITGMTPERKFLEIDPDIISLALFGSYADGSFDEKSDVDFLVVTPNRRDRLIGVAEKLENELGKEVSMSVFGLSQWRSLAERKDAFYSSIMRHHILLYGGELL